MPRNWLYYVALILPLAFRILILNTGFVDWLWYQHYEETYYTLAALRVQPQFLAVLGNWALLVFIVTVICWWHLEDGEGITSQFLLLPLAYVPFSIIGDVVVHRGVDDVQVFMHPLVILPIGYAYVFTWVIVIWVLAKLRLVIL